MTAEEMTNLERVVEWRLARWRDRGDYDDMRQEAMIGAWKAIERTRGSGYTLATIAVHAADHAAREWLRSAKSDSPHYGWRRPYPQPEMVSLENLVNEEDWLLEARGDFKKGPEPFHEDFSQSVLERLERHRVWVAALGTATPRQAAVLRASYRDGLSQQQIAERTGRSWSAINQLQTRAMARCRAAGLGDEG